MLRDLGAEVIKVEDASGGDYLRYYPPLLKDGNSALFHALNRGKVCATQTTAQCSNKGHNIIDTYAHAPLSLLLSYYSFHCFFLTRVITFYIFHIRIFWCLVSISPEKCHSRFTYVRTS